MKGKHIWAGLACVGGWGLTGMVQAQPSISDASGPQNVALSLYDQGFALVSEMRRLTPARGDNLIRFRQLPLRIEPVSVSFVPMAGMEGLQVLEQRYRYDLASAGLFLDRFRGQPIEVVAGGQRHAGVLMHAEGWSARDADTRGPLLVLDTPDGGARLFLNGANVEHVVLPDTARLAEIHPLLEWRTEVEQEGPQSIRLNYRTEGIQWHAVYEVVLDETGQAAFFGARIGLRNESGADFAQAQVQVVATERGMLQHQRRSAVTSPREQREGVSALRYAYGASDPTFEEEVAGLAPAHTYRLPRPVSLGSGAHTYVQYARVDALPVERFYVYDGVRFDRFQRNRRNDWNYGTESHAVVETHLQFENERAGGLGIDLPPGRFRLYQRLQDGAVEFLGEDQLLPTPAGASGHVRLGPARGLRGERERTGYTEITPLRVYEESFQILLENNTTETVDIRVVEHLYRWHEFEIVRADAEFEQTAGQTIEFRPTLRPGGRRTIHYTVRYSW